MIFLWLHSVFPFPQIVKDKQRAFSLLDNLCPGKFAVNKPEK